tara:strand:- start:343 stop:891 length:549 start_codon:yes stop_codon:yes gene_type:complete
VNIDTRTNDSVVWVLIHTKANQELIAENNLNKQGFKTFLPLILSSNKDKHTKSSVPVFPRYLFAQINIDLDNWNSIKSTYGVNKIVMFSEYFPSIPSKVIKLIKEKLDKSGVYKEDVSFVDYKEGDKVSIKKGKFEGVDAIFLSKKSNDRVRLLLKFLNSSVVAEITKSDLGNKEVVTNFKF